ncbi:MAG: hypothetical protein HUJ29_00950 [Gammaproteobacteria bacterium]|nr:hypothetical protein [Gammaproteobacteria bacterium]
MMHSLPKYLLISLMLGFFGPLAAEDYVIEVPVKLERLMNDVGEVMVTCEAINTDEDVIGSGQQKAPIRGGAFDDKLTVSFDADYGKNPHDATRYRCIMRLRQVSGREYTIPQSTEEEPDWPIWARAKAGTELVYQVEGELATDEAPAAPAPE